MSKETQTATKNRPNFALKVRNDTGDNVRFDQIGVAWKRDNGSMFCRLVGNQVISSGFYLFPINQEVAQ